MWRQGSLTQSMSMPLRVSALRLIKERANSLPSSPYVFTALTAALTKVVRFAEELTACENQ